MTNKPDTIPLFATEDQNFPSGNPNVIQPTTALQNYGYTPPEFLPAANFNWLCRYYGNWIAYLSERINIPEIFTMETLPSPSTLGVSAIIYISDEATGPGHAYSDGTNWRRMNDRQVVQSS